MKKRNNEHSQVSEVLKEFIDFYRLKKGLNKIHVKQAWSQMMGAGVANYTEEVQLRDRTLIIRFNSSAIRHELSFEKNKIKDRLNEFLGEAIIDKIIFA